MVDVAIRTEHLSKRFVVPAGGARRTLKQSLGARVDAWLGRAPAEAATEFWALRNVAFELRRGSATAIVGKNGAGKSTLLRILARVTHPTTGRAELFGRVASVLEIATGFQPDLTGRDNIYLYGALLGMRREAITRRFDEIVAFAEIERFLDVPVKRYSTGMYMRLAFAVAAHLDADILLIDEALAVGDVRFQRKSLSRLEAVASEGRTVVFVSHDPSAVARLADTALWLENGRVRAIGDVEEVLALYSTPATVNAARRELVAAPAHDLPFWVTTVRSSDGAAVACDVVGRNRPVLITIEGEIGDSDAPGEYFVAVDVFRADGTHLFRTSNLGGPSPIPMPRRPGPFAVTCVLPPELLHPGRYHISVLTAIAGRSELQAFYPALEVDVIDDAETTTVGMLAPRCDWRLVEDGAAA